ncbi:DUF4755 domain-containing protein [Rugamonas sp.]|uniref:DUF4755 domain-containing protein n=1 Tax=Rugamonas sp. TaxID=1926287 RepID=UPI0025DB4A99|nr:DUF4755 domain-containing protein [Rugamonas sp.]
MLFLSMGWRLPTRMGKSESEARSIEAWARRHAEMLDAGGVASGRGLDHSEDGTGIALNPKERLVLLLADGAYKSYDYEDVLDWRDREARAEMLAGGGLSAAWVNESASAVVADCADELSSLFVSVRDREIPMWRISMRDKMDRERWMEILREQINNGSAPTGAERATEIERHKHFNEKGT